MPTVETVLPLGFEAPRAARAFLRATLRSWHLDQADGIGDVVDLLASELVSNSVVHVGSAPTLRMTRAGASVRVEVEDTSAAVPVVEEPDDTAEHGRGVMLVARMADDWGYDFTAVGKSVWFELRLPVAFQVMRRNGTS